MGEPVKIIDLARDLITLSGFVPGEDIEIELTGLRPGEKLFEELAVTGEHVDKTRHPKIFINRGTPPSASVLEEKLLGLKAVVDAPDHATVRARLKDLVPEYTGAADAEEEAKPAAPAASISIGVPRARA
jgi:FlaA1/EpsC-like NDP-sugar epimerase